MQQEVFGIQAVPVGTGHFQQRIGADDIGLNKVRGTVDRTIHMRLSRQVHDHIGSMPAKNSRDPGMIADIHLHEAVAGIPGYARNAEHMLRVIRNHRRAAKGERDGYEAMNVNPVALDHANCPDPRLVELATEAWDEALALGEQHGYRNAQATVIAPTGTIGLVMDCDTTGIEPDFALVKFKKLAGGGYFKIVNQSVPKALENLGYDKTQIKEIVDYIKGHGSLEGCPSITKEALLAKGFTEEMLEKLELELRNAFDIKFAFNPYAIEGLDKLVDDTSGNVLAQLGFSNKEIELANDYVCGTMMIEGAPHLKEEH